MNFSISGNVAGSMSVSYGGSQQRVNITTSGSGFSAVTIDLTRG